MSETEPKTTGAEIVVRKKRGSQLATRPLEDVLELRRKVVQLAAQAMKEGVDYGIIPGCEKPSLWQPGAQKINSLFQLHPVYERQPDSIFQLTPVFILHAYLCRLIHSESGIEVSQGVGSCNSGEEKYGWRKQKRQCPKCGKATIIAGNPKFNKGIPCWICWKKDGRSDGCGVQFNEQDPAIISQPFGRIPNENILEQENTIRKQAAKRALIAASLNLGISDIFTQDVETMAEFGFEPSSEDSEDLPLHREKHEHFSTLCKICLDLGVPEGERVLLLKNHLYLRSMTDHGKEFGTLKFCPGCQELEQQDQRVAGSPPSPEAGPEPAGADVSTSSSAPKDAGDTITSVLPAQGAGVTAPSAVPQGAAPVPQKSVSPEADLEAARKALNVSTAGKPIELSGNGKLKRGRPRKAKGEVLTNEKIAADMTLFLESGARVWKTRLAELENVDPLSSEVPDAAYYAVLGNLGVEHANELLKVQKRLQALIGWSEAYKRMKLSPPAPEEPQVEAGRQNIDPGGQSESSITWESMKPIVITICDAAECTQETLLRYVKGSVHGKPDGNLEMGDGKLVKIVLDGLIRLSKSEKKAKLAPYQSKAALVQAGEMELFA